MKVVLFSTRFAFEYSIELANALANHSSIKRVVLMLPENYLEEIQKKVISHSVIFYPYILEHDANIIRSVAMMKKILRKIQKEKPDILHIQGSGHFYFFMIFPFLQKFTIVDTIHDATPHPGYDNFRQRFMRWNATRYVNQWFTHGEYIKQIMIKHYKIPAERIHVIPKGHYGVFKEYTKKEFKSIPNMILFFGTITRYKGLEYLIKAEPFISREIPDAKIVIAGKVRKDISFKKLKRLMVHKENFIVKNYRIPHEEASELFQKASVIVLPYIEASQSGVLSIAYGLKKPVVVTDVGALPEIVVDGKTGLIVPPRDTKSLADAIITILKDKRLQTEMGKNAYNYAMNELSWDRIAKETVKVYIKALEMNNR